MRYLGLLLACLLPLLASCGRIERWWSGVTGGLSYRCAKSGVEYVQTEVGSIVVLVNSEGKPVPCNP